MPRRSTPHYTPNDLTRAAWAFMIAVAYLLWEVL